jgi:hypothetical protein
MEIRNMTKDPYRQALAVLPRGHLQGMRLDTRQTIEAAICYLEPGDVHRFDGKSDAFVSGYLEGLVNKVNAAPAPAGEEVTHDALSARRRMVEHNRRAWHQPSAAEAPPLPRPEASGPVARFDAPRAGEPSRPSPANASRQRMLEHNRNAWKGDDR